MPRKALSAKLDQALLAKADRLGRKLKISRNRALEEGLSIWIKLRSRQVLARQMKAASMAVRGESLEEAMAWDPTLLDGLDEDLT